MRGVRRDHAGETYGRLTVLRPVVVESNGRKRREWWCRCACGTESKHLIFNLVTENVVSCGCVRREEARSKGKKRTHPRGKAFVRMMHALRGGAKTRDLPMDLTEDEVAEITQQNCFYCGRPPQAKTGRKREIWLGNGIDRVDSDVGYTTNNVVPCCSDCNRMKWEMSVEQFREHVARVYRFFVEMASC